MNGINKIETWAFLNCKSLMSIRVPSSVTTIGNYALGYTSSNYSKFEPIEGFKIYCTDGSRAYQYASAVSVFQTEIITDSVDEIIVDDTQPEENSSSLSPLANIINYITNFDIRGFLMYVFDLIVELIGKYSVLF
jgi:hypothetical protein